MVAHEKIIWLGCVFAAPLFVLVLAGCADVSESGSSQTAQPTEKNPPTETGGPRCSWWARQLQTPATRHARTFLRARRPSIWPLVAARPGMG
jgi:hypothetical protein